MLLSISFFSPFLTLSPSFSQRLDERKLKRNLIRFAKEDADGSEGLMLFCYTFGDSETSARKRKQARRIQLKCQNIFALSSHLL